MRNCQASAWPEVATFLIKRKWPKIDQGGPWTPLRRQAVQGGCGLARHWFHGRFQASALPLGGLGPAAMSVRSVLHIAGLYAALWLRRGNQSTQGGRVSPDSAANSGRAGLTPPSLAQRRRERQSYPGASGGPDSAANRAAGRADTPRWKAVAPHGGPGGSPAALCHFLSAEKVKPGPPVRPE